MAFDKEEIQQLEQILTRKFDEQRSVIMADTATLLEQKLRPIREDISYVKQRLNALFEMESEDIQMNYKEIEKLKAHVRQLEQRIAALEH